MQRETSSCAPSSCEVLPDLFRKSMQILSSQVGRLRITWAVTPKAARSTAMPPVCKRSHTGELVKDRTEIALVAKPHLLRDLRDWVIRLRKRRLRSLDAVLIEIISERAARQLAQIGCKLDLVQVAHARGIRCMDHIADVPREKLEELLKALQGALLPLEGIHTSCVGRVVLHQQNQNRLQIGLDGQTRRP